MANLKIIFNAEISKAKAALSALKKHTQNAKKEIEKPAKGNFGSLISGAKAAAGKIKGFMVGALAFAGISAGAAGVKRMVDQLDGIGKSSRNLGVSAEEFQKLTYAAESVNMPVEQLNSIFTKTRQTIGDAARGVGSAQEKLAALGLKAEDLANLRPYEQFQKVAQAIRTIPSATDRASASVAMFGEQGLKMTNFMNEFENLGNDLAAKGAIIPDQAIADAEELTQQFTNIQRALSSFAVRSGFISELREIAEGLEAIFSNAQKMQNLGVKQKEESIWKKAGRGALNAVGGIVGMGWAWGKKGLGDTLVGSGDFDLYTDPAPSRKERDRMRAAQKARAEAEKKAEAERAAIREKAKADRLAKAQQSAEEKANKSVADRLRDMQQQIKYQQMIAAGKAKEAAIEKEIAAAEKAAGRALTAEEKAGISAAAAQLFDLNRKSEAGRADTAIQNQREIYSDTLLRMGGKIGAIGTSSDYTKRSFDRLGDIRRDLAAITNRMGTSSGGSGTITFD